MIMRIMTRYTWLAWAGLLFLVYLTYEMLHDGWPEAATLFGMAVVRHENGCREFPEIPRTPPPDGGIVQPKNVRFTALGSG